MSDDLKDIKTGNFSSEIPLREKRQAAEQQKILPIHTATEDSYLE